MPFDTVGSLVEELLRSNTPGCRQIPHEGQVLQAQMGPNTPDTWFVLVTLNGQHVSLPDNFTARFPDCTFQTPLEFKERFYWQFMSVWMPYRDEACYAIRQGLQKLVNGAENTNIIETNSRGIRFGMRRIDDGTIVCSRINVQQDGTWIESRAAASFPLSMPSMESRISNPTPASLKRKFAEL